MKPPLRRTDRLADVLDTVLKRVDPEQQLPAYGVWKIWDDVVGAAIAQRAQPLRVRNGILFVAVATHAWLQELQYMKDEIRERLNGRLGADRVRDIYFVSGQLERRDEPEPPPATLPHPAGPVSLPPIADPQLAAAWARIVEARARRGRQTPGPRATPKRR